MDLNQLRRLGFDLSYNILFTSQYRVLCSQCEALVINGVPTHEHGCTNARHECKGCSTLVPANAKYCSDCLQSISA